MITSYITYNRYTALGFDILPADNAIKYLKRASKSVDVLTFGRSRARYEKLTAFQKSIIEEVTAELADFYFENEDVIDTILQNYSINGVSMSFGESWNVAIINGVAIKKDVYNLLRQSGLCNRSLLRG